MKVEPKTFDIEQGQRPKVLLLGNGINRAYDFGNWDDFLDVIKLRSKFPEKAKSFDMPMALKATMLTNNRLAERVRKYLSDREITKEGTSPLPQDEKKFLESVLRLPFDYVLTTNYTYELEEALTGKHLSHAEIDEMRSFHTTKNRKDVDHKYYLHTFNNIAMPCGFDSVNIWHVHGEMQKPESIIASHDGYCRLVSRINNEWDDRYASEITINSWIEAFLVGDVYIVGFGCDFSEMDIWWLLNKKCSLEHNREARLFSTSHYRQRRTAQ